MTVSLPVVPPNNLLPPPDAENSATRLRVNSPMKSINTAFRDRLRPLRNFNIALNSLLRNKSSYADVRLEIRANEKDKIVEERVAVDNPPSRKRRTQG